MRHADYVASWLEVLRDDNRAIVRAASQASKAADFLLASSLTTNAPRLQANVRRRDAFLPLPASSALRGRQAKPDLEDFAFPALRFRGV